MGETLAVVGPVGGASTQWLTSASPKGPWRPVVGAQRSTYSPEPADAGAWLACRVETGAYEAVVVTPSAVAEMPGTPPAAYLD